MVDYELKVSSFYRPKQQEQRIVENLELKSLMHDLASPVSVIKLSLQLLEEKEQLDEACIRRAKLGISKLEQMISGELKDFQNNPGSRRYSWSIKKLISELITEHRPQFKKENINIVFKFVHGNELAYGQKLILQKVLDNLLVNSFQALAGEKTSDKKIWIELLPDLNTGAVQITIADNGPGIPSEVRAILFRKLFTTKKNGHGLGLYASAIALQKSFSGTIAIVENPYSSRGACFLITLPTCAMQ